MEILGISILIKHAKNNFFFKIKSFMFQLLISKHIQKPSFKCNYNFKMKTVINLI